MAISPDLARNTVSPPHLRFVRTVVFTGGVFAAIVGLSTFAGWVFSLPLLKDWSGTGISMKTNTALCALSAGVSILLVGLWHPRPWSIRLAQLLAAFCALVGALTFSEHLFGWNLGIDTLLFDEPRGARATTAPNRMGPPAAVAFFMVGTTLVVLASERREWLNLAVLFGAAVFSLGGLSLLGYAYGASELFAIRNFTGIALQTGIVVLGLGAAVTSIALERARSVILSDGPGGTLARDLSLIAFVLPPAVGYLAVLLQRNGVLTMPVAAALVALLTVALLVAFILHTAVVVERTSEKVHESNQRFQASLQGSPTCVYMNDAQLRYVWVYNPPPPFDSLRMIGKRDDELLPQEAAEPLLALKREVLNSGRGERRQIDMYIDGRFAAFDYKVEPWRDGSGNIVGLLVAATDITPIREAGRQRQSLLESERAARQEAERAARSRDEFIAMVSHELRTPLNSILGWSQMLKRQAVDPQTQELAVNAIERGVRTQARLIEDLLDMSRILSGKLRIDVQRLLMLAVVEGALETVRAAAEAKHLTIHKEIDASRAVVRGDPSRLQQVVWNLLTNAVKFTPKGGSIRVSLKQHEGSVELAVADTGQGIKAEDLPHIFGRFYQADSSISRQHGGLGLGLAIVRYIVEQHGGTVAALSDGEGAGSTFTLRLPSAEAEEDLADLAGLPGSQGLPELIVGAALAGVRVLVVDDDSDARHIAQRFLNEYGAQVTAASSGAEALSIMEALSPHVVLCDLGMPGMDGYETVRRLRATHPTVPAVALTAFARAEDRIKALAAGYTMHLAKPVEPRELVAVVSALTRQKVRAT